MLKYGFSVLLLVTALSSCQKTASPNGYQYAFGVLAYNHTTEEYRPCATLKVDVEQNGRSISTTVEPSKGGKTPFLIETGYVLNITATCLDAQNAELGKTTWSQKVPNIIPDGYPDYNGPQVRNALKSESNSNPVITPPKGM